MRNVVLLSHFSTILCAFAPDVAAADTERGRLLYELRCGSCHSESVHGRTNRVARSFEDIAAWVARWNTTLALNWGAEELEHVSVYLNATYYRYACPPTVCKLSSMALKDPRVR